MNIQSILIKIIPVILGLVIYNMFIAQLVNKYDDSFDSYDELKGTQKNLQNFSRKNYRLAA